MLALDELLPAESGWHVDVPFDIDWQRRILASAEDGNGTGHTVLLTPQR
jgi:hypothetical protein